MKNNQLIINLGLLPVSFLAVRNDNGLLRSARNDVALCTVTVKSLGGFAAEGFHPIIAASRHCEGGVARSNPNDVLSLVAQSAETIQSYIYY